VRRGIKPHRRVLAKTSKQTNVGRHKKVHINPVPWKIWKEDPEGTPKKSSSQGGPRKKSSRTKGGLRLGQDGEAKSVEERNELHEALGEDGISQEKLSLDG